MATDTWDSSRNSAGYNSFTSYTVTHSSATTADGPAFSITPHSSGKWIAIFKILAMASNAGVGIGLGDSSASASTYLGNDTNSMCAYGNNNWYFSGAIYSPVGFSTAVNDLIDLAVDETSAPFIVLWIRQNAGSWFGNSGGAGDPVAGTSGLGFTMAASSLSLACNLKAQNDEMDLSQPPPALTGYTPWTSAACIGSIPLLGGIGCGIWAAKTTADLIDANPVLTRRRLLLPHREGGIIK